MFVIQLAYLEVNVILVSYRQEDYQDTDHSLRQCYIICKRETTGDFKDDLKTVFSLVCGYLKQIFLTINQYFVNPVGVTKPGWFCFTSLLLLFCSHQAGTLSQHVISS